MPKKYPLVPMAKRQASKRLSLGRSNISIALKHGEEIGRRPFFQGGASNRDGTGVCPVKNFHVMFVLRLRQNKSSFRFPRKLPGLVKISF